MAAHRPLPDDLFRMLRLRAFGMNEKGGLDTPGELLACARDPQFHGWLIAMRSIDELDHGVLVRATIDAGFRTAIVYERLVRDRIESGGGLARAQALAVA